MSEEGGAAKRHHSDEGFAAGGVGRGGQGQPHGPPGPPAKGLAETLAAIQAQLTIQTTRMSQLADKDHVRRIADKVDALSSDVATNSSEI